MKATTVKEALIATKWILQHYGWTQGDFFRGKNGSYTCDPIGKPVSGFCLVGAMSVVEHESHSISQQADSLVVSAVHGNIPAWNDAKHRTKQEVIDLLDKLISEA